MGVLSSAASSGAVVEAAGVGGGGGGGSRNERHVHGRQQQQQQASVEEHEPELNHLVFEGIVLFDENNLVLADVNGDGQVDIISNGADGSKATVSYFDLRKCFAY